MKQCHGITERMKRFARFIESKGGLEKISSVEIQEWIHSEQKRMNTQKLPDESEADTN